MTHRGLLIDGTWRESALRVEVRDKYSGAVADAVDGADSDSVEAALSSAQRAASSPLTFDNRRAILERAASAIERARPRLREDYVAETGFTVSDANGEISRAAEVFRLSAAAVLALAGEEVPVRAMPGSTNRLAFTIREPVGVVVAIGPFNAPLSTIAHKIAPALAAGNAVILKPSSLTPLSAINLAQILLDAGLPGGYLSVVIGPGAQVGQQLAADPRVRFITFTGSTSAGLRVKAASHLARLHMELGSNSATIVAPSAHLTCVVDQVMRAGYRKAGQVCTSVQRLLVDRRAFHDLEEMLAQRVATARAGDPTSEDSAIGPVISRADAERIAGWIGEARRSGARVVGGDVDGNLVQPAMVADPSVDAKIVTNEVFGPVVSLVPVDGVQSAIALVNAGNYGLQAGIFTQDVDEALWAARHLRVGGVMVNDTSSYHADNMPYGGVKDSGFGTQGPTYAARDMTDPKIIVLNTHEPDDGNDRN